MAASQIAPPIIIKATATHTASLIFFHGLGDQGDGWASVIKNEIRIPYMKSIFPNAQSRPVTLNYGMRMPAWYDIIGLSENSPEDNEGIEQAKNFVHGMIRDEIAAGIPSRRIVLGGFSMGAALAIYAGLTFDQPLGAIFAMSGFLLQRDRVLDEKNTTANRQTPIFLGHGHNDPLVPYTYGDMTWQALSIFNKNVMLIPYDSNVPEGEGQQAKASAAEKSKDGAGGGGTAGDSKVKDIGLD
uniref:palmitoyl-protein hydrolase n=1 Tax=Globodera rostochiensis TaxID=31243 RepID=A0A914IAC1_GLORO